MPRRACLRCSQWDMDRCRHSSRRSEAISKPRDEVERPNVGEAPPAQFVDDVGSTRGRSATPPPNPIWFRLSTHQREEDRVDDLFENLVGYGGEGRQELVAKQV